MWPCFADHKKLFSLFYNFFLLWCYNFCFFQFVIQLHFFVPWLTIRLWSWRTRRLTNNNHSRLQYIILNQLHTTIYTYCHRMLHACGRTQTHVVLSNVPTRFLLDVPRKREKTPIKYGRSDIRKRRANFEAAAANPIEGRPSLVGRLRSAVKHVLISSNWNCVCHSVRPSIYRLPFRKIGMKETTHDVSFVSIVVL